MVLTRVRVRVRDSPRARHHLPSVCHAFAIEPQRLACLLRSAFPAVLNTRRSRDRAIHPRRPPTSRVRRESISSEKVHGFLDLGRTEGAHLSARNRRRGVVPGVGRTAITPLPLGPFQRISGYRRVGHRDGPNSRHSRSRIAVNQPRHAGALHLGPAPEVDRNLSTRKTAGLRGRAASGAHRSRRGGHLCETRNVRCSARHVRAHRHDIWRAVAWPASPTQQ